MIASAEAVHLNGYLPMMIPTISLLYLAMRPRMRTLYHMNFDSETYLALTRQRIKIDPGMIEEKHWKELAALLAPTDGRKSQVRPKFDEDKVRLRMEMTPTRTIFVDQQGVATDTSGEVWKLSERNFRLTHALMKRFFRAKYTQ